MAMSWDWDDKRPITPSDTDEEWICDTGRSIWADIIGTSTRARMLEIIIEHRDRWLTLPEIADRAGVQPRDCRFHLSRLVEFRVLARDSKDGVTAWTLNPDSDVAQTLATLDEALIQLVVSLDAADD